MPGCAGWADPPVAPFSVPRIPRPTGRAPSSRPAAVPCHPPRRSTCPPLPGRRGPRTRSTWNRATMSSTPAEFPVQMVRAGPPSTSTNGHRWHADPATTNGHRRSADPAAAPKSGATVRRDAVVVVTPTSALDSEPSRLTAAQCQGPFVDPLTSRKVCESSQPSNSPSDPGTSMTCPVSSDRAEIRVLPSRVTARCRPSGAHGDHGDPIEGPSKGQPSRHGAGSGIAVPSERMIAALTAIEAHGVPS